MNIKYIVTTKTDSLNGAANIAMVDGTVPGWKKTNADLHFDHHRPGGAAIQVDEMPPIATIASAWVTRSPLGAALRYHGEQKPC